MSYYKDTVHGLIEPLINGQADLTLTYNVDEVWTYCLLCSPVFIHTHVQYLFQSFSLLDSSLLLCIYPITGTAYIPSSPVLAILTPTLTQGQ